MSNPNPQLAHYTCDHYTVPEKYLEYAEPCEDCGAPILWSCCNDELDPSDEAGGFCPSCKEHNL